MSCCYCRAVSVLPVDEAGRVLLVCTQCPAMTMAGVSSAARWGIGGGSARRGSGQGRPVEEISADIQLVLAWWTVLGGPDFEVSYTQRRPDRLRHRCV